MSKKNKIFVLLAIIIVVVILVLSWQATSQNQGQNKPQGVVTTVMPVRNMAVNLFIDGMQVSTSNMEIRESSTVFQLLESANTNDPAFALQFKNYDKMGILVEGISGKINGQDKKYWQYSVNGIQPMVGADKYVLKNDDKVEWFFKESSF